MTDIDGENQRKMTEHPLVSAVHILLGCKRPVLTSIIVSTVNERKQEVWLTETWKTRTKQKKIPLLVLYVSFLGVNVLR